MTPSQLKHAEALASGSLLRLSFKDAEVVRELLAERADLLAFVEEVVADLDSSRDHADLRPEYEDMFRRGLKLISHVPSEAEADHV